MLIAQIGSPPATIHDRSVVIYLTRKKTSEQVRRFDEQQRRGLHVLARKAARWVRDHGSAIKEAAPLVLEELNDRANDNWRPLFAIADTAGGPWPQRARHAARLLSEGAGHDASSVGEMLISDIRRIFDGDPESGSHAVPLDRIASAELVDCLVKQEGRPWAEWRGKPITQNALARLLKTFKIYPGTIRPAGRPLCKGYLRSDFETVFEQYGDPATVTPSQSNNDGHFRDSPTVTANDAVTVGKSKKTKNDGHCDGVTVDNGEEASWTV